MTQTSAGVVLRPCLIPYIRLIGPPPPTSDVPPVLLSSVNRTVAGVFDDSYLAALRAHNSEVENHLITFFSRPVRLKLRARLRSPELVEDASQETFLRVITYFRSGKTLDRPASLPGFIHTVCHNVALEFLRAHTRQDQLPENHQGPVDTTLDPQNQMVNQERKALVRQLLDKLPEKDRQLLGRVFLDEADKDVVCAEFHVDRGYLRSLLFRARQRFRLALSHDVERRAAVGT